MNRCIAEGLSDVEDSNKIKDAEKDIKTLRKAMDTLTQTKTTKRQKLDDILSFHQLVEEVSSKIDFLRSFMIKDIMLKLVWLYAFVLKMS